MRIFLVIYLFVVIATVSILGFRGSTSKKPPLEVFPDMDRQAKYSHRPKMNFSPTAVTIALFLLARLRVVTILTCGSFLQRLEDEYLGDTVYHDGKNANGSFAQKLPLNVTYELIEQGERNMRSSAQLATVRLVTVME